MAVKRPNGMKKREEKEKFCAFDYRFDGEKRGYTNGTDERGNTTWKRGDVKYTYEFPDADEMEFGTARIMRENLKTGEKRQATDKETKRFIAKDENGDPLLNPFGNLYWKKNKF